MTLARRLRRRGWHDPKLDGSIRGRIYDIVAQRRHWWDWGHPVMRLVGREYCGNAAWPRADDLYYVHPNWLEKVHRPWFADWPTRCGFYATADLDQVRAAPDAPWKVFDLQDDGHTLLLAWRYQPGGDGRHKPASIQGREIDLLWRWWWIDHRLKAQWLGLRPWLYRKALHAAVHERKPFACNVTPERGAGGYPHWHCRLKRRHPGPHRYGSYVWPGPGAEVAYEPELS